MQFYKVLRYTGNPHIKKFMLLNMQHIVTIEPKSYDAKDLTSIHMIDGEYILVNTPFKDMLARLTNEGWL